MKKLILLLAFAMSGCTMMAPPYQVSIENVQQIKNAKAVQMSVGEVSSSKELNSISLRGSKLVSPVGGSYGEYLSDALVQELKLAKLWSGVSDTVISGELVSNDIDVSGFSVGTGEISAKFVVTTNEKIVFEKVISANHQFDSSFVGSIAIPNGQASYKVLVQKLLNNLFTDQQFVEAVKI